MSSSAQQNLPNAVALVNLLLDSTPGGVYGIDLEGQCTFCNPALLRLLGYEHPSEVLGKNSHCLFHHTRADGSPYPQEECPVFDCLHDGRPVHVG